jgi:hypothetical protein
MAKYKSPYSKPLGIKIRPSTYDDLVNYASMHEVTMAVVVDQALQDFFAKKGKNNDT